ncbi:polysaccharide deacetylase family protein [Alphaproteobacteria bacterium]|nr:polysaccharide deacetylase family protein [Alphaproteobacteria bacterium]
MKMLIIKTPPQYQKYRLYVCSVIFGEWFQISWRHEIENRNDVSITLENTEGELLFSDIFFSLPTNNWLKPISLPKIPLKKINITPMKFQKKIGEYLPVLYGEDEDIYYKYEKKLKIPIDILGSIFFMLSGYEELICKQRDDHGRFPGVASLLYRSGYLDRPLADEYAELMWNALLSIWPRIRRVEKKPTILLSCDVDEPFDCSVSCIKSLSRACIGDFIKRFQPLESFKRIRRYINNRKGNFSYDPCYTFEEYLKICSEYNLKATFYFIPSSLNPNNCCYNLLDVNIQNLMKKLFFSGHEIAMHGCYENYQNTEKTNSHRVLFDKALIKAGINQTVKSNRQHYLRWDAKLTPAALENAGFTHDSTGGYADCAGFRYGTSKEFTMWDWSSSIHLKIRQRPLIVMDVTIIDDIYMGLGYGKEALSKMIKLKERCLLFGGQFTILWHNTSLKKSEHITLLKAVLDQNYEI